ncbi:MAG: MATE family efflux transporter [Oscillospiraceae bacterium]|nr:MATE family efflux transporter [Oscillospiraceae bacterium]
MKSKDMTQGNIWKLIILFAIPLMLGNLLQQLYNAFDAIIVGNYVGKEALAAVGSSGPLINMIIAFFMGMSTGASVLISQFFGAKDDKSLHDTVHTAVLLSIVLGAILSVIGMITSPWLLRLMRTPDDVIADATLYLRIYFAGLPALTVYNMGAATLTAVGDAKRPLYFLAISSVINIVGNLFFVLVFDMGVSGVALSTVIAEVITAVLVLIVLMRSNTNYKLYIRDLRIHLHILKRVTMIGLPGGIQQAIISFSNIIVQSYINRLGAVVVAGYSACTKLDAFIMLPVQTMALAVTTYVGQNLGAHKVERARKGVKYSMIMGIAITVVVSVLALIFGKTLLRIFSPDPDVLETGMQFMRTFVPMYFILGFTQIIPGALRGAGDVRVSTLTCILCFVPLRQLYLFIVTKFNYSVISVALSYPLTWTVAAVILFIYYKRSDWSRFAISEESFGKSAEQLEGE